MQKIHIGEKIQQRAKELRIGPTELAEKVNTSKQNIYSIFKRKSLDTQLLKQISKALDYDFFQYFVDTESMVWMEDPVPYGKVKANKKSPIKLVSELRQELDTAKKELNDLKEKYELLKKVNLLLEKRNK